MEFISERLLREVYTTVSRALFKPDKMIAALHIAKEMKPASFEKIVKYLY